MLCPKRIPSSAARLFPNALRCADEYSASPRVKRTCVDLACVCIGLLSVCLSHHALTILAGSRSSAARLCQIHRIHWPRPSLTNHTLCTGHEVCTQPMVPLRCLLEPVFEGCLPIVNCSGIDERMIDTCRCFLGLFASPPVASPSSVPLQRVSSRHVACRSRRFQGTDGDKASQLLEHVGTVCQRQLRLRCLQLPRVLRTRFGM